MAWYYMRFQASPWSLGTYSPGKVEDYCYFYTIILHYYFVINTLNKFTVLWHCFSPKANSQNTYRFYAFLKGLINNMLI